MPRKLPQVGTRDLNTVTLSPELRKILRRRAHNAAKRVYAPILAADRQAFRDINRAYQTEAKAVRGATSMVQESLAQALAGLKRSGLRRGYLRQAVNELTSRQADAARAIPFLLADARENRARAMSEAQQELNKHRAEMLQASAGNFNQLLKEARTAGSSLMKERKDRARAMREAKREGEKEGGLDLDPVKLRNAELALKDALRQWAKNPTVEIDGEEVPLKQLNPLRTRQDWERFAVGLVGQYPGFGLAEADAVIRRLLANRARKQRQGRQAARPQPAPGPGRWAAR